MNIEMLDKRGNGRIRTVMWVGWRVDNTENGIVLGKLDQWL